MNMENISMSLKQPVYQPAPDTLHQASSLLFQNIAEPSLELPELLSIIEAPVSLSNPTGLNILMVPGSQHARLIS